MHPVQDKEGHWAIEVKLRNLANTSGKVWLPTSIGKSNTICFSQDTVYKSMAWKHLSGPFQTCKIHSAPILHQVAECSTLASTELLRVPVQNSMSEAHLTKHWHTLAYSKADGNTWHACICIHIALAKPRHPKPTFLLYPFNLKCLKRRQWINKWQHNKQPMAMRFFCVRHFFWTVKVPK